jgi:hypothetical protein
VSLKDNDQPPPSPNDSSPNDAASVHINTDIVSQVPGEVGGVPGTPPPAGTSFVPVEVEGVTTTPFPAGTPTVPAEVSGASALLPAGTNGPVTNIKQSDMDIHPNPDQAMDQDEKEDEDDITELDDLINVIHSEPDIVPSQTPIDIVNSGVQVCMFDYRVLPTIGKLYRVNNNHQLIQVFYKPGQDYHANPQGLLTQTFYQPDQTYQADSQGKLHAMGWVRI